jgi:hypothetical protein
MIGEDPPPQYPEDGQLPVPAEDGETLPSNSRNPTEKGRDRTGNVAVTGKELAIAPGGFQKPAKRGRGRPRKTERPAGGNQAPYNIREEDAWARPRRRAAAEAMRRMRAH